jgi:predicted RNA-binding protein with PUA-like domain
MRTMAIGDSVFFYHSNTKIPGIVGLMEVIENNVIDPTQFDPQSDYYDPKSSSENPRWQTVKVKFVRSFPQIISLDKLKETFRPEELLVVKKGNRLSVIPIATNIAEKILILV